MPLLHLRRLGVTFVLSLACGFVAYFLTPATITPQLAVTGRSILANYNKYRDLHLVQTYIVAFILIYALLSYCHLFEGGWFRVPSWEKLEKLSTKWSRYGEALALSALVMFAVAGLRFVIGRLLNVEFAFVYQNWAWWLAFAGLAFAFHKSQSLSLRLSVMRWSQIFLPFVFLALVPIAKAPSFADYWVGHNLKLAVPAVIMMVAAWICLARHKTNHLTAWSWLALALMLHMSSGSGVYFPGDHYHFGEALIPYWLVQDGAVLFRDFYPAHGWQDAVSMQLGHLLWGDISVENTALSYSVEFIFGLIAVFAALRLLVGSMWAGVLTLFFPVLLFSSLYIVAIYALLMHFLITKRWNLIFLVGLPLFTMLSVYQLSFGIAASCGAIPIAIWALVQGLKQKQFKILASIVIAGAISAAILLLSPISLGGIIQNSLENSAANMVGFGTPWTESYEEKVVKYALFELLRTFWAWAAPVLALAVFALMRRRELRLRWAPVILLFSAYVLMSLMLMNYTLGRIDVQTWSRTGTVSLIGLYGFAAILAGLFWKERLVPRTALVYPVASIVVVMIVCRATRAFSFFGFAPTQSAALAESNEAQTLRKQLQELFPHAGNLAIDSATLQSFAGLKSAFAELANPTSRYLDLTNNNTNYFMLQQKPLLENGAYYNLAHPAQRLRGVEKLKKEADLVVLLGPKIIRNDQLSIMQRVPEIVSELTSRPHQIVTNGELHFLVTPPRAALPAAWHDITLEAAIAKPEPK